MGRFDGVDLGSKRQQTYGIVGLTQEEVAVIRALLITQRECPSSQISLDICVSILRKMGEENI